MQTCRSIFLSIISQTHNTRGGDRGLSQRVLSKLYDCAQKERQVWFHWVCLKTVLAFAALLSYHFPKHNRRSTGHMSNIAPCENTGDNQLLRNKISPDINNCGCKKVWVPIRHQIGIFASQKSLTDNKTPASATRCSQ